MVCMVERAIALGLMVSYNLANSTSFCIFSIVVFIITLNKDNISLGISFLTWHIPIKPYFLTPLVKGIQIPSNPPLNVNFLGVILFLDLLMASSTLWLQIDGLSMEGFKDSQVSSLLRKIWETPPALSVNHQMGCLKTL